VGGIPRFAHLIVATELFDVGGVFGIAKRLPREEMAMFKREIGRRSVLAGASAVSAAALIGSAQAQPSTAASAASLPARREFVMRNAHVLSMDEQIGDLPRGDVHVRDGAIIAVGQDLAAPGAEVIDCRGMICMPGFVETHWHHWTSFLRPVLRADDPKKTYFPVTFAFGFHYTPEDSYRAVRLGLAEALSAGVTTTHNWAHNVRSPAHADAEVQAMRDGGLRGRFSYGTPLGLPNDQMMDIADLARLKRDLDKDPMLALGVCSRNVDGDQGGSRGAIDSVLAKKEWGAVRELGLPITLHTSGSGGAVKTLNDAGLLGPDLQLVHPLNMTADEWTMLAKNGVHYSTSPIGEAGRAGEMQVPEIMQAGVKIVSISIDNVTAERCDCFACMHMLQTIMRHRTAGKFVPTTKKLVQMATIGGAQDLGLDKITGSLTPGKRADIILVRTDAPHMRPLGDPYDALVQLAQPSDVDTTIVDGRVLFDNGDFTALDYDKVEADAMQSVAALSVKAKWS
jgi:5-methylthioadenosine/S-adenosylhomocysteine deaminase